MTAVLIGSQAIKERSPNFRRSARDLDYLIDKEANEPGLVANPNVDTIAAPLIFQAYEFASSTATLDEIFTLKVSHSAWRIKTMSEWLKHLEDIKALQLEGAQVIEQLYEAAYKQWEVSFGKKLVNLAKDEEEFFNSKVKRYYVHDSVHEAIALGGVPGFKKILKEGETVLPSKALWDTLTFSEKSRLVYEETMVLSLERDLIPYSMRTKEKPTKDLIYKSYRKQLHLLITQYSKGWFPRWIIENYFDLFTPPLNYWQLFEDSPQKILIKSD